ncbi:MAG: diguanylate cyclase [Pseudomonadota bacterium]|nr:diguanylate cyclase [Pseudomonadota bacterium]
MTRIRAILLLMLIHCCAVGAAASEDGDRVLLVAGQTEAVPLSALRFLIDPEGKLLADQALAQLRRDSAMRVESWPPTYGFSTGVYWFHLTAFNQSNPDPNWLLVIEYALLDQLDLYVYDANGARKLQRGGDREPFSARRFSHRHFNFALDIPKGQSRELLLRVDTESSMQVPLLLITETAFLGHNQHWQLGLGMYYGLIFGLLAYNLLLFLSTRDRSFLYYVLYAALFVTVQANINGLTYQYLWPNAPVWDDFALILFIPAALIAVLAFTRRFLDLRERAPAANRILVALMISMSVLLIAAPFIGYRLAIRLETASVFLVAAVAIGSAISAWRSRLQAAKYYLLAWTMMLIGIVVYAAVSFGLLPKNIFTEYGILFGSAAEMVLLSFALAFRINELQRENHQLHAENAERMELRVNQRTNELNEALGELQSANRRLREYSQRDGLTGAHNRYFLDEELERALKIAHERGEPLSLLMVDIDHFKLINDRYGHLAGDSCLCAVASKLRSCIRETDDFVARFGGEEFVVLLPGADRRTANARAELLRKEIEAMRVSHAEQKLAVTVSIGFTTQPRNRLGHARELLQQADRALYVAKEQGRNRVVMAPESE